MSEMLGPPRSRSKGCFGGPSFKWMAYWMTVLWVAAAGYFVIRPWLLASLPPIFRHVSDFELLLSALASLIGIAIAAVMMVGAMAGAVALDDRLSRLSSESNASADTTVQSPQETES